MTYLENHCFIITPTLFLRKWYIRTMLMKTISMQRHWKETTAMRRAPSSCTTQGVSSLQQAQPCWQGRQSLEDPSSVLGLLSAGFPFLPIPVKENIEKEKSQNLKYSKQQTLNKNSHRLISYFLCVPGQLQLHF